VAEAVKMGEITVSDETTLDDALSQAIKAYADREAVVIGDERLTFSELGERLDRLAAGLHKLGLGKGDVVVLFLPTSLEFVYLYWALGMVGAVVAPVNPLSRQAEIAHILADSEAKAAVFAPEVSGNNLLAIMEGVQGNLPNLQHLIMRGSEAPEGMIAFDSLMSSNAPRPPAGVNEPDDLWALLYTSGTTGAPKGVMHTHRSAMGQILGIAKLMAAMLENPMGQVGKLLKLTLKYGTRYVKSARKQRAWLVLSPIHATAGHYSFRTTTLAGDRFVAPVRFHPVRALEMIEREQASMFVATPSMYRLMLEVEDFDRYDKSSLLTAASGMAYMPPELGREVRRRFKCPLTIGYGSTEGGGITSTSLSDGEKTATETIGTATGDVKVRIIDDDHKEVPRGEVGEIAVRGPGIMTGYYKAPDLTAEVLNRDGWYRTGDLGTMDDEGVFKIVGRKKDMIIRGGQNIFPPEIEGVINGHSAVLASAVVGVPAEAGSENVWAFVVAKEGQTATAGDILKLCRRDLIAYKVPSEVRFVDELPMAARMKVQKYKLRAMAIEELENAGVEVSTDTMLSTGPEG
jgi:acyl-CoA synthetase (AMP-forming)/AMP-acid ligase II